MTDPTPRPAPDQAALARCLAGIRYPGWWEAGSWVTSIGSSIRHAKHRRAAEFYAKRHVAEHGCLPEGLHHVVVSIGPTHNRGSADIEHPFSTAYVLPQKQVFEADITFPPARGGLAPGRRRLANDDWVLPP